MKKQIIILLCILLILVFTFSPIIKANASETITITDSKNRSVQIKLPVKRIVVLPSDALEIVRALGARDYVVGISDGIAKEPLFWPQLKDRPVVGSWSEANYELIVELNPDIVICYGRWPGMELEKKLEPFGIKVVRLDFYKIPFLEKEIKILGRILKKEKKAQELIEWHREKLNLIKKRLKTIRRLPNVYVESYTEYHSVGPGSGGHEICIIAGGHNIAANSSIPYPEVTPEWVVAKNPDIVVKAASLNNCYGMTNPDSLKNIREGIMARPAWDNIQAVQDNRVYVLSGDIWAGPRCIIGISYLAKWFYPDLFKDIDPKRLHREYLEKFQGIKYHGEYVYP